MRHWEYRSDGKATEVHATVTEPTMSKTVTNAHPPLAPTCEPRS